MRERSGITRCSTRSHTYMYGCPGRSEVPVASLSQRSRPIFLRFDLISSRSIKMRDSSFTDISAGEVEHQPLKRHRSAP